MTAKERLNDIEEWSGIHESHSSEFRKMINEYALHIGYQAVESELIVPYYHDNEAIYQKAVCNRILSRIKTLTENE